MLDAEVILVGGGPSGLMLANELGRRGIRTLLIDQDADTATNPQANATQARTMEHYRRLGFADEIRAEGLPPEYPTDIAYFTRYTQHELARFQLPSAKTASSVVRSLSGSWSAAELPHRVSQMFVERVLHRHAAALPCVTLRHEWRVTTAQDRGDHVELRAEPMSGGGSETLRATYVVGCDGARSALRQSLGIRYGGEGGTTRDFMGGRMHAIYFRFPQFYDLVPHAPAWMYWAFNPQRRSFMAAVDGQGQFAFHTQLRSRDPDDPAEADARRMFDEAAGISCDIEILSRCSWTAGLALVADRFGQGRILLAGDAVHLFTPTGGLGYNTAIEDAVNLGWKLAAVLRGWGGPLLLDSYEAERRPVALRNTGFARAFADSVGLFAPAPEIEEDSARGAAARTTAGAYLDRHARAEFDIPGITFGGRYDLSPIIVPDGTAPPPDAANRYVATACPGGRAPHLWLPNGRSLFDAFGFEFTLLRLGSAAPDAASLIAEARTHAIPLTVLDVPLDEARALYGTDLALVRPDQVVCWRGDRPPSTESCVFQKLLGYH
jgi:2-polyprenyl-6-methoxyphenol hydroxylase-like FAD-dependent oxidoreductase